jgi:hypothetical protein
MSDKDGGPAFPVRQYNDIADAMLSARGGGAE